MCEVVKNLIECFDTTSKILAATAVWTIVWSMNISCFYAHVYIKLLRCIRNHYQVTNEYWLYLVLLI